MGASTEAEAVAEVLGITVEEAANLLRKADQDFHPEQLVRDIAESLTVDERRLSSAGATGAGNPKIARHRKGELGPKYLLSYS